MCSYHGWTFGSSGQCTSVPQADDERRLATALSSQRSCASAHPIKVSRPRFTGIAGCPGQAWESRVSLTWGLQVANGLVWVWADAGPEAGRESGLRQPATHPLADDPRAVWIAHWFSRSLPYSADVLAENVLDPSHVYFSHHGILGNRKTVRPPAPLASVSAPTAGIPNFGASDWFLQFLLSSTLLWSSEL